MNIFRRSDLPLLPIGLAWLTVVGLFATLPQAAHALNAQTKPAMLKQAAQASVSQTCPDMIHGQIIPLPDGGYLDSPQGWIYQASVTPAQNGASVLVCSYSNFQRTDLRSSHPAYTVHYQMNGFSAGECRIQGFTATCRR